MLQSPTDTPLYVASESETRLFLTATSSIISRREIIGSNLQQLFLNKAFSSHFNISTVSPIDVLKLLRQALPSEWFDEGTVVVDQIPTVSDDWLRDIWNYIINAGAGEIFDGSLPLLPVYSMNETNVPCLIKLRPGVPLLHMAFKQNISTVVLECLNLLGLYVYNPEGWHTYCCVCMFKGTYFSICI